MKTGHENRDTYGAVIERGIVQEANGDRYRVASLTRSGIVTPPIPSVRRRPHTVGEKVFFFLFEDGQGAIIAAMT